MDRIINHCVTCDRSLARVRQRHRITRQELDANPGFAEYVLDHLQIQQALANNEQWMCHRCWVAAGRHQLLDNASEIELPSVNVPAFETPAIEPPAIIPPVVEPPAVQPPPVDPPVQPAVQAPLSISIGEYRRAANTSRRCIFPNCTRINLLRIPQIIKLRMLLVHKLYIPEGARVCNSHINENSWTELDELNNSSFTSEQIKDMLDTLIMTCNGQHVIDFDTVENMTAAELHFCVGLTHGQFQRILDETPSLGQAKRPKTVLGAYLMKLRSGEPNVRLAARLGINRRTFERNLENARQHLMADFVPRHLGWDHISRNEIISRNLMIPNALYGENGTKAVLIFDGTYIYVQKSSNFLFQKLSYSLHKYRNLLKPYFIVCTDGYIIDVLGLHAATTSDATIMSKSLHDESPMHVALQAGDVFVLDRGFRDSLGDIEEHGYIVHMPPTKNRHESQLSTEAANKSRMVTIVRWVVEVVNGRLKRDFKLLRHEYFNRSLSHLKEDVKIASALTNVFKEPVIDTPLASQIIAIIHERLHITNRLGDYVEQNHLNRQRAAFRAITDAAVGELEFPVLSEEDLVLIALGTYQIKLARSYLSEHIRNGTYTIEVCEAIIPDLQQYGIEVEGTLLRGRIQSRHISNRTYYSYIIVNRRTTGRDSINNYYCSCLTGRRTIGTCAHIMSIIWYLGWARHENNILLPARFLDDTIVDFDY